MLKYSEVLTQSIYNYSEANNYTDGSYTVHYYCKDTFGNENYSEKITIFIDVTPPLFTNIANKSIAQGVSFNYNVDATDGTGTGLNIFAIQEAIGAFSINAVSGVITNTSAIYDSPYMYYFNISITDIIGNKRLGSFRLNITEAGGVAPPSVPAAGIAVNNFGYNFAYGDKITYNWWNYNGGA
jgi:hypothetical protein